MKIDIIEIQKEDYILIQIGIGNLTPNEINEFMNTHLPKLQETFGCSISVIPFHGIGWDFTIIRNPTRSIPSSPKKLKKVA
jgi:hypothetical protein